MYDFGIDKGSGVDQKYGYQDSFGDSGDVIYIGVCMFFGNDKYDLIYWHVLGEHLLYYINSGWLLLKIVFQVVVKVGDGLLK